MMSHPPGSRRQKHKRNEYAHKDIAYRQPQDAHPEQPRNTAKAHNRTGGDKRCSIAHRHNEGVRLPAGNQIIRCAFGA